MGYLLGPTFTESKYSHGDSNVDFLSLGTHKLMYYNTISNEENNQLEVIKAKARP